MTRDEKKAETRRQLLDAADRVFRRDGYFGASLEDVAREAGFSKGAVYSNFESKEDLLISLTEERIEEQARNIDAAVDHSLPLGAMARDAAQEFRRTYEHPAPYTFEFEFRICVARNPELRARMAPRYRAIRDAIADYVRKGSAERGTKLKFSPERIATMINAFTIGLSLERLADPESVPDDLFGEFLAMLFEAAEGDTTSS